MDRDNFVGVLLLGMCALVAGVLIYSITTGTTFRYTGPGWLAWVLLALFLGGILASFARGRRRGGDGDQPRGSH